MPSTSSVPKSGKNRRAIGGTKAQQPEVKRLRVLILAATSLTSAGLERLIETQPGLQLVGAVNDDENLLPAVADNDPDVVVWHVGAGSVEMHWEQLVGLGVPVVLLIDEVNATNAAGAIAGGVNAVLTHGVTGAELTAATHGAVAGLLTVSTELFDLVRQSLLSHLQEEADSHVQLEDGGPDGSPEHLTLREREVLELIVEGFTNKEIAAKLRISTHTAKFHISSIMDKLGASTRTEAAAIGLRRGLITI